MAKKYPLRPHAHQLEEMSRRFFTRQLPRDWVAERPANDYGVDLRVDIFEGRLATGLELLVQIKGSEASTPRAYETIRLQRSTYNYLWDKLQVVMLVKYVDNADEAYWELLRNVTPKAGCKSFSARIPKDNRLSRIDWGRITELVRAVTDRKVATQRRHVLRQRG